MAAPHVTGVAALTVESHRGWSAEEVRAAIANTTDASQVSVYRTRLGGGGLAQPFNATRTRVIATNVNGGTNLSFGVREFSADFSGTADILVRNRGATAANATTTDNGGATLAVPYFLVSRARSQIGATVAGGLSRSTSSTVQLRNDSGAVRGSADFYSLGLIGQNEAAGSAASAASASRRSISLRPSY